MCVLRYKTNNYPKPFKEGACQVATETCGVSASGVTLKMIQTVIPLQICKLNIGFL